MVISFRKITAAALMLVFANTANSEAVALTSHDTNSLSFGFALEAFTLRKTTWDGATPLYLIMQPQDAVDSDKFFNGNFGLSAQRIRRIQRDAGIKSVGRCIEARDSREAAELIGSQYGSLGYADESEIRGNIHVIVIE